MVGNRIGVLLDYLRAGNEVEIDGATYVWLDKKVVREDEEYQYIIDGLAIKMYPWTNKPGEVHYVGASHISVGSLVEMVSKFSYDEFVSMYNALEERGDR